MHSSYCNVELIKYRGINKLRRRWVYAAHDNSELANARNMMYGDRRTDKLLIIYCMEAAASLITSVANLTHAAGERNDLWSSSLLASLKLEAGYDYVLFPYVHTVLVSDMRI